VTHGQASATGSEESIRAGLHQLDINGPALDGKAPGGAVAFDWPPRAPAPSAQPKPPGKPLFRKANTPSKPAVPDAAGVALTLDELMRRTSLGTAPSAAGRAAAGGDLENLFAGFGFAAAPPPLAAFTGFAAPFASSAEPPTSSPFGPASPRLPDADAASAAPPAPPSAPAHAHIPTTASAPNPQPAGLATDPAAFVSGFAPAGPAADAGGVKREAAAAAAAAAAASVHSPFRRPARGKTSAKPPASHGAKTAAPAAAPAEAAPGSAERAAAPMEAEPLPDLPPSFVPAPAPAPASVPAPVPTAPRTPLFGSESAASAPFVAPATFAWTAEPLDTPAFAFGASGPAATAPAPAKPDETFAAPLFGDAPFLFASGSVPAPTASAGGATGTTPVKSPFAPKTARQDRRTSRGASARPARTEVPSAEPAPAQAQAPPGFVFHAPPPQQQQQQSQQSQQSQQQRPSASEPTTPPYTKDFKSYASSSGSLSPEQAEPAPAPEPAPRPAPPRSRFRAKPVSKGAAEAAARERARQEEAAKKEQELRDAQARAQRTAEELARKKAAEEANARSRARKAPHSGADRNPGAAQRTSDTAPAPAGPRAAGSGSTKSPPAARGSARTEPPPSEEQLRALIHKARMLLGDGQADAARAVLAQITGSVGRDHPVYRDAALVLGEAARGGGARSAALTQWRALVQPRRTSSCGT
jgi:hypothetical protein